MLTQGVLRGLHFQKPYPQCKVVRAVRGTVFDVAVDLRSALKLWQVVWVILSAETRSSFLSRKGLLMVSWF